MQSITATGNIQANNKFELQLSVTQKVIQIVATEGQMIKKGDVLLKFDTSDYEYQLQKANINLSIANDALNKLINTNGSSTENAVQQAQVNLTQANDALNKYLNLDLATEKSTLQSKVNQAKINFDTAINSYNDAVEKQIKNEELHKNGYLSDSDYGDSQKAVKDTDNSVKSLRIQLQDANKGLSDFDSSSSNQIANQKNQVRLSEIALSNAKNNLSDFGTNTAQQIETQRRQVELIKADVDNLNQKIQDSSVKSTIDGKVVEIDAKENQYPKAADKVVVEDISIYKAAADVSQYDAVNIIKGQKSNVKIKGLSKKYSGTVTDIAELAQTSTTATDKEANVNVKVSIDNKDDSIKDGYQSDAEIIINEKKDAISVSFEAIKADKNGGKYVYKVVNNKVVKKSIKTGLETDYDVEVISGLASGEKCILNPTDTLKDGETVISGGSKK